MNKIIAWLMNPPTDGPKSILILRLMAGGVFFWEGLLKFVYANQGLADSLNSGCRFHISRRASSEALRSGAVCFCLQA